MEIQAHIQLSMLNNIDTAIIVGDPKRVETIGLELTNIEELVFNREYRSIKGSYKGIELLVMSTGIGAPSTAIAIEELYNIGIKRIIRVGSCGAMQQGIDLGELVIPIGTVRDEGLTGKYVPNNYPAVPSSTFINLAKELAPNAHYGISRSHDGFYMPNNEATEAFWSAYGILGGDMETSALFVLGSLKGIETLSILNNVVLYQEDLNSGVNNLVSGESKVAEGERQSILLALDILKEGMN